jgi:hypothetical protein
VNKMKEIQDQVFWFDFFLWIINTFFFLQRKTSADKSRNIVKGRRISQVESDGKKASLLFCIYKFILGLYSKNDDGRQLSGRKRAPIDLDNTEGVFSQQGFYY